MHAIPDDEWQRIRAYYYGMISLIDKQVGRMIEALRQKEMLDNTIILFTSDHGEMLGDHHLVFKGTTFDQVTNVPLLIVRPGEADVGGARQTLANSIDVMPTLLDLAGIPIPEGVQGSSLAGALADPALSVREATLIESPGIRRSVRTQETLLTWHGQGQHGELYDLREDPNCLRNLWDRPEAAALQREMLDLLIQLMAENVDPLPPRVGAC
jgi:arylsulfatase A-like enzyme